VVGRRLSYEGLAFVRDHVFPRPHADPLSVRGPYNKKSNGQARAAQLGASEQKSRSTDESVISVRKKPRATAARSTDRLVVLAFVVFTSSENAFLTKQPHSCEGDSALNLDIFIRADTVCRRIGADTS
jgi:hypothetical protein